MLKNPEQNFQDFFFQVCLKEDRRLADVPLTESTDKFVIQNGKLEGGIALGIVGGIVGFALGGVPVILTGITMGFALGSSLFGGNSGKKPKKPKAPTFSFDGMSGDSVATQGTAIPIIYTSILKNPLGGVRIGGKLIACRVENRGDSGNLYAVLALSLGEIGYIDDSKLLIDNQSIDRYYEEDLNFQYLSGTPTFYNNQGQNSLTTDFNFFGQCISPNSYNLLGTSKRAQAKNSVLASSTRSINDSWGVTNCFISSSSSSGKTFTKNAGSSEITVVDSFAVTNEIPGEGGGTISWQVFDYAPKIVGFGTRGSNNMTFGIRTESIFDPQTGITTYPLSIIANGSTINSSVWTINDNFQVELGFSGANKVIRYKKNNELILAVSGVNWSGIPAKVVIQGMNTSVRVNSVSSVAFPSGEFGVGVVSSSTDTATLVVYEDEKDSIENWSRFTPAEIYEVNNGGINNRFRVTKKRDSDRTIVIKPSVTITEDDDIFAIWEAFYETSKKVNKIVINFEGVLFSRRKPLEDETEKSGKK